MPLSIKCNRSRSIPSGYVYPGAQLITIIHAGEKEDQVSKKG